MLTQFSKLTVVHTVSQKGLMPAGGCDGMWWERKLWSLSQWTVTGPFLTQKAALLRWGGKCSFHPTSAVSVLTALEFYCLASLLTVLLPTSYIPQERHNSVLGEFFIQDPYTVICDLIYTEPGKKGMQSLNQHILQMFITHELTNNWRPMHFPLIF